MKAIIKLDDVPEFQIGQIVRVSFPDSAVMYGKCKPASGWISVKDRLPEKEGQYLCWFGKNIVTKGAAIATYLEMWKAFGSLESLETYPNVTHWMPLPEPPEEVTGEGGEVGMTDAVQSVTEALQKLFPAPFRREDEAFEALGRLALSLRGYSKAVRWDEKNRRRRLKGLPEKPYTYYFGQLEEER